MNPAFSEILRPIAYPLLLACGGVLLIQSMKGLTTLDIALEKMCVALLALVFIDSYFELIQTAGSALSELLTHLISPSALSDLLKDSLVQGLQNKVKTGGLKTLPPWAITELLFQRGAWGIMTSIADFAFLVIDFLLSAGSEVIWELIRFLAPVGIGLFPLFPRVGTSMAAYAIELSLWKPLVIVVQAATARVAARHLGDAHWGLPIVAIELVAIYLFLSIPGLTHRLITGGLSTDLGATDFTLNLAKRVAMRFVPTFPTNKGGSK